MFFYFYHAAISRSVAERLVARGSESDESLQKRLDKAEEEIAKSQEFDSMILNDDFDIACKKTMEVIHNFIKS